VTFISAVLCCGTKKIFEHVIQIYCSDCYDDWTIELGQTIYDTHAQNGVIFTQKTTSVRFP
jgi:hypothetical protein